MIFTDINNGRFYNEDCFDAMKEIPNGVIDMLLVDLPYGTTQNKWDSVIPLDKLWLEYNRICKNEAVMVFTSAQPFTSTLVISNIQNFKFEDIWHKSRAVGHLNAKRMPLREHENILIFCRTKILYNPQYIDKENPRKAQRSVQSKGSYGIHTEGSYRDIPDEKGYPRSVIKFNDAYHERNAGLHPTQKPIGLFEYLIKTYSNENNLILDNTAGSGTTAIAAINTKRRWVCIEKEKEYYDKAIDRIIKHSTWQ